jgi:hypothetical protein
MADGSFPIRNRSDLRHALRALGRARDVDRARDHIAARARTLGLTGMLPERWAVTSSGRPYVPEPFGVGRGDWDPYKDELPEHDELVAAMVETLPPAIGLAPLVPPAEWFEDPQLEGPTPLTVTADGRVYGHLAEFGKCHRGISGRCVFAPRSKNGYQSFYAGGHILLDDGEQVPVGRLTVNAHHAPLSATPTATAAHYDHSGVVAAFVRAGEDQFGPWLAGATRSDATPEQIRDLRANPPSGDWRNTEGRGLELVAALAVPVPGFPVMAVTASMSGGGEEVSALILGFGFDEPLAVVAAGEMELEASYQVKTRVLAARMRGGVSGLAELFR